MSNVRLRLRYCILSLDEPNFYGALQSPVTPQRRTVPTALSPKHNQAHDNLRRHRLPPRDPLTPQVPSLAQANARLIHDRLEQNHNRLQVQLHAASSPLPAGPVKAFLDTTFRAYASRIQTEFNSLRTACARAIQRERHQTQQIRSTCARLAHERDVAEDKVRVLLDRRAAAAAGTKRTRAQVEQEDADADDAEALRYPLSPVSPPQLPTQSPPPRLMSPFVLAVHRSPSHTPDPEDRTGFDLTVAADSFTLPRSSKRRRMDAAGAPEAASIAPSGDETETAERATCPPAGFGECDMDLGSGSESEDNSDADFRSSRSHSVSQHSSRAASASGSPPPEEEVKATVQKRPTPTPTPVSPQPARQHLPLEYVDIMYLPTDGKLVCRVCLLAASTTSSKDKHGPSAGPIRAFVPGVSWEMLRTHSEEMHSEACRDVVGLGQSGVQELRRRLGLGVAGRSPSPPSSS
ncbi:hypothetical protein K438DRAFT_1772024 [Mycena galopus ATCC 62051]|nr:hypothetical protein K438DRAFT_1772024 [Mycena galopus ATCC 62051]